MFPSEELCGLRGVLAFDIFDALQVIEISVSSFRIGLPAGHYFFVPQVQLDKVSIVCRQS